MTQPSTGTRRQALVEANRVLIIDDDPLITKVLEKGLQKRGYTTAVGRHGADATYLVLEFEPDLVLLDIMLPDVDGEEICTRIRAHGKAKNTKIISLSAVADQNKIKAMHKAGIDLFIPKPFKIEDITAAITGLIGPIREKKSGFGVRHRKALLGLIALVVIGLAGLTVILMKPKGIQEPPKGLHALEKLAKAFREHDANGDKTITTLELKDLEQFATLDANQDSFITHSDGEVAYKNLIAELSLESVNREKWLEYEGNAIDFRVLDRNNDEHLNTEDFTTQE